MCFLQIQIIPIEFYTRVIYLPTSAFTSKKIGKLQEIELCQYMTVNLTHHIPHHPRPTYQLQKCNQVITIHLILSEGSNADPELVVE